MRNVLVIVGLAVGLLSSGSFAQSPTADPLGHRGGSDAGSGMDPRLQSPGPLERDRLDDPSSRVGRERFDAYTDRHGNTSGPVGDQRFDAYTDRHGITTGRVGDRQVDCHTDRLGFTTCR